MEGEAAGVVGVEMLSVRHSLTWPALVEDFFFLVMPIDYKVLALGIEKSCMSSAFSKTQR